MIEYALPFRGRQRRFVCSTLLLAALALLLPDVSVAQPAIGQGLWQNTGGVKNMNFIACQGCHGPEGGNKIGATTADILRGLTTQPQMVAQYGSNLNATDIANLAAYLANPQAVPLPVVNAPAAVAFGNQAVGTTSAPQQVTISHGAGSEGAFQLAAASAITLTGTDAGNFAIAAGGTCANGTTLPTVDSCTINVTFTPTAPVGTKTASLRIAFATPALPPITVFVNGSATLTPTPVIALSATTLALANTLVGSTSAAQTVTLTNNGSAALNITALTPGGANPTEFTRSGTCTAPGTVTASGGTCTLVYTFTPTAAGARSANLTIVSNNGAGNVTLNLTGTGASNTPEFAITAPTPPTLTFNTALGTTSAPLNVTVRNNGGGTLAVSSATASNAAFAATVPAACSSLALNQTCNIEVRFTPAGAGANNATLTINHNAGAAGTVTLNGNGATTVPAVAAAPATVNLPLTAVGQQSVATTTVTFTNSGPGAVTLTSATASAGFVLVTTGVQAPVCTNGMNINQGGVCRIGVKFAPTAAGAQTGTLTFASSGTPANATVTLNGTGSATAAPDVRYVTGGAAMVGPIFPATKAGALSTAIRVTISNIGTAAMTFPASNVMTITTGFNPTDFKVENTTCAASAPLQPSVGNCVVDVIFNPAAAGLSTRSAILLVNFSGGAAQVPLYGVVEDATGTPTTPGSPTNPGSPGTPGSPTNPTSPTAPSGGDDGGGGALPLLGLIGLIGLAALRRRIAVT